MAPNDEIAFPSKMVCHGGSQYPGLVTVENLRRSSRPRRTDVNRLLTRYLSMRNRGIRLLIDSFRIIRGLFRMTVQQGYSKRRGEVVLSAVR